MSAAALDLSSAVGGQSRPENDTREWLSYGLVSADAGDVVQFRTDLGQPLVSVELQPSKKPVYARVGAQVAGNGEGEWHPFVQGDEVLVALPEGYEDMGAVIIARLNNKLDAFPMDSIAGQDPTTNTFAFSRRRTPFVHEYAGPIILRSALNSALFSIDAVGAVTLKDSENAALQLSADVIGFSGPSTPESPPEFLLQLDLTHRHFSLQVGDAVMTLSASDGSPEVNTLTVPGPMTIGTIGNPPLEHAMTVEATANLLEKFTAELAVIIAATGAGTGSAIGAAIAAWMLTDGFTGVWGAAAGSPVGSVATALPAVLTGLLATPAAKPNTGGFQEFPGLGALGLLIG